MKIAPEQELTLTARRSFCLYRCLPSFTYKHIVLLVLIAILLLGSGVVSQPQSEALAANPGAGNACSWYRVHSGDTLGYIARVYRTTIWTLARVNGIRNINLIFTGQLLCIPYAAYNGNTASRWATDGLLANGAVRWYAYDALEWSNTSQVAYMLRAAAARYGLPANLLLAIAWQESGWRQHVIARDGGIGVMQIMPYTGQGLNMSRGVWRDPYKLWDNIDLGASYLRSLWNGFHGNLIRVISAYNEGGWNVLHRGIFNWSYVNSVLVLMRRFR